MHANKTGIAEYNSIARASSGCTGEIEYRKISVYNKDDYLLWIRRAICISLPQNEHQLGGTFAFLTKLKAETQYLLPRFTHRIFSKSKKILPFKNPYRK